MVVDSRTRLYVAGLVAALAAYIFAVVAFTGALDVVQTGVFAIVFLVVLLGFERFMLWAERFDSTEAAGTRV